MAFFNSTYDHGNAPHDEREEVKLRSSPKKARMRLRRPEPIITRGPLALIWVNPNPPPRRERSGKEPA